MYVLKRIPCLLHLIYPYPVFFYACAQLFCPSKRRTNAYLAGLACYVTTLKLPFRTLCLGELLNKSNKFLYSLQRNGVVVAGTNTTHAAVALKTSKP